MVKPDLTLTPQDWMHDPDLIRLFAAIREAGGEARYVGGCVRDVLLGRAVHDIDMAVTLVPEDTQRALTVAGIKSVPTGLDFGTVTAVLASRTVEMTSLRRDVETDGRRAVVAYTTDWQEDALRRDFTINALYADQDGHVFDYYQGHADIIAKRLRFVGDPDTRLQEDVLRILRFFRFHAQLGFYPLETDGLAACTRNKNLLSTLSAERVAGEVMRLLKAENPIPALTAMRDGGFLTHWLPETQNIDTLSTLIALGNDPADWILRLASLCPSNPVGVTELAERLKLSGTDRARLQALADPITAPKDEISARRYIYSVGSNAARDRARLGLAQDGNIWQILSSQAEDWQPSSFPISGKDALALGLESGPDMGRMLKDIEAHWIGSDFTLSRAALIDMLKEKIEGRS
ncbi:MAG: CCA tRNA nucleotidyltransferase [Alphaproteobacteria bacterium]|nr:CCA tRNA nucleotidyltransferase [Alphaproteobacteria bacterium]